MYTLVLTFKLTLKMWGGMMWPSLETTPKTITVAIQRVIRCIELCPQALSCALKRWAVWICILRVLAMVLLSWICREHVLYSGASPILLVEYCVTFRHDRRLLSLLGFVHNWPTSRWSATNKENWFSLNGNGIMSSFLGWQYLSFHLVQLWSQNFPNPFHSCMYVRMFMLKLIIPLQSIMWWTYLIRVGIHHVYIYIYIYIYCHPQTDCFVVSQLFSVARYVGHLKLGPKPAQLYIRLNIRPLGKQVYHVGKGIIRYYVATAAFVCLHFIPYRIPECSIHLKSFALCEWQPKIPSPVYTYLPTSLLGQDMTQGQFLSRV